MYVRPNALNFFNHMSKKPDEEKQSIRLNCDLCSNTYDSETDVDIHRKTVHEEDMKKILHAAKEYPCTLCIRKMGTKEELLKHVKVDHFYTDPNFDKIEWEIYGCDYCGRVFFHKGLLEIHIQEKHLYKKEKMKKIICPKCNMATTLNSMWNHVMRHGLQSPRCCKICLKNCTNRNSVYEHMSEKHLRNLICSVCGYSTTKCNNYLSHFKTHSNDKTPPKNKKKCDYKNFFFPHKHWKLSTSRVDIFSVGLRVPDFINVCILCRHICTDDASMKCHIFVEHMPDERLKIKKTHQCLCGQLFFNMVLLKHHVFKLKGNHAVLDDTINDVPLGSEVTVSSGSSNEQHQRDDTEEPSCIIDWVESDVSSHSAGGVACSNGNAHGNTDEISLYQIVESDIDSE